MTSDRSSTEANVALIAAVRAELARLGAPEQVMAMRALWREALKHLG